MTLLVNINHWLDEDGDLPTDNPRLFRQALRIVRFIEYGGALRQLQGRDTLVQCRRRPGRTPCPGWMWVMKRN